MPINLQRVAGGALEHCYIDLVFQPIRSHEETIEGIFVQGHDVTEAHKLAQESFYHSTHDSLTGLYNRREFTRKGVRIDKRVGPHVLLFLDLDHFKVVNDRAGHAAGDAMLLHISLVLKQCTNRLNVLARLGGDEFAVLLTNFSEDDALELAHTLRRRIREMPFIWNERRFSTSLSIGLSSFGQSQSISFHEALSLADVACSLAKEKGRNRVQIGRPSDNEIALRRQDMDWIARIEECIREDRIVLHAQRICAMQSRHETGFQCWELLARLLDVDGNLVFPGGFIPAAERFGLIDELDRHIVRKAFSRLNDLPAAELANTRYFINISGITLGGLGFSDFVSLMIDEYPAVRPSNVCFEVTETAAISNLVGTSSVVQGLVELGYSFALDDFGSGMSSFSYLEHLPVQYIKIDGEFIKGILTSPAGTAIVKAVVEVARAMNMLTVAESVEYPELIPHLQQIGIDYGQGFALHRPELL